MDDLTANNLPFLEEVLPSEVTETLAIDSIVSEPYIFERRITWIYKTKEHPDYCAASTIIRIKKKEN